MVENLKPATIKPTAVKISIKDTLALGSGFDRRVFGIAPRPRADKLG